MDREADVAESRIDQGESPFRANFALGENSSATPDAGAPQQIAVTAKDVSVFYGKKQALFSVNLNIAGSGETCGSWEYTQRAPAAVLVCGEPTPAAGFDGLFTYEAFDGLLYQMINQVDTSVYGCVERIEWHVFEGTDTSGEPDQIVAAWSPKIEFPSEGTYTVVLNVGGPGGVQAHKLEIDVVEAKGNGSCSTAPLAASLAGLVIAAGAALRRRRS